MESNILSSKETRRYKRHIMLPEIGIKGQEKLLQAKVLVVGAGGLGCPVLQYLAAAGVGVLGLMDDDVVDESNLQRQVLYGSGDIGKHKAIVAKQKLTESNDLSRYNVLNIKLNKRNVLDVVKDYDIVVDATDNFPSRYLINDACIILNKPMVYGAIYKFQGQVAVFNYKGGPSYRCLHPTPPKSHEATLPEEEGVIGVLPGIVGSLQANEVIKIIIQKGEVLSGKLWIQDIFYNRSYSVVIKKHAENFRIKELGSY
ncbi:MAG: HesA/MoeB/ThiF family protein [Bacteroidota bacterium]|nr:HesA/MoeB/ThiF family protein [Bacteroidota bacterium]